jgi:exosortase/archaeosortase family protein
MEVNRGRESKARWAVVVRTATFLVTFALLQLGWQTLNGTAIENAVVHEATVRPAALLIRMITPVVQVRAVGLSLVAPGGGISILNGCEGSEALFLLLAAFVAAPIPRRARLAGFLFGVCVVFVLNELRIVVLFYSYRADHALFDLLHTTLAPIVVVMLLIVYVYAWLALSAPRAPAAV